LTSQGLTNVTVEDLRTFISSQTKPEVSELDGSGLEHLLRKFLTDQTKSDENEIEKLAKKLNKTYLNGDVSVLDDKDAKEKDGLELELKDRNEIIDDIILWKSHMELGPAATPVIMLNDLIS
jgi:hypothetical protein